MVSKLGGPLAAKPATAAGVVLGRVSAGRSGLRVWVFEVSGGRCATLLFTEVLNLYAIDDI